MGVIEKMGIMGNSSCACFPGSLPPIQGRPQCYIVCSIVYGVPNQLHPKSKIAHCFASVHPHKYYIYSGPAGQCLVCTSYLCKPSVATALYLWSLPSFVFVPQALSLSVNPHHFCLSSLSSAPTVPGSSSATTLIRWNLIRLYCRIIIDDYPKPKHFQSPNGHFESLIKLLSSHVHLSHCILLLEAIPGGVYRSTHITIHAWVPIGATNVEIGPDKALSPHRFIGEGEHKQLATFFTCCSIGVNNNKKLVWAMTLIILFRMFREGAHNYPGL